MNAENPYFGIFRGRPALKSKVLEPNKGFKFCVDQALSKGLLVGQYILTEGEQLEGQEDMLLSMAKPVNNIEHTNGEAEGLLQAPTLQARLFYP